MIKASTDKWFDERPRVTKRCERCGGCGAVEVAYALVPADEVAGAPSTSILAFVVGAFDIFTACREAADIAKKASNSVAFEFGDLCVVVRPGDDPEVVARRWWAARYNETPEESLARR